MQPLWWQSGVIYQIYPRSFMDSNADGIGDLPGIVGKLDYLSWLGVDALWLSPIYPSPMADFGYDVSNFVDIEPTFGSLRDLDVLIAQAHARGLKIILDFIPNHTSDEHPWFRQSRSQRTNEKRDWYIWRDPAPGGGPPNNWLSRFTGSAWQFDGASGQYYLHLFDVKQPDLNWRNPQVRRAMYDVMRFWLERGVDGFRIDALSALLKDEQWRDNPLDPAWKPGDPAYERHLRRYTRDLPGLHAYVREMRAVVDAYDDRVLIGEIYLPLQRMMLYYGEGLDEVHLPFNFQLVTAPAWEAQVIRRIVDDYEGALPAGGWPNWVLSNHDQQRVATRVGLAQARIAHMLLLTLRGTPTCYYGDELGMRDGSVPPAMLQDPRGKEEPALSRDYARTPMQWGDGPNAGFNPAGSIPWLPLAADYAAVNVVAERGDPRSFLSFTRSLLALRRALPALSVGSYHPLDQDNAACFVYLRQHAEQRCLLALNLSPQEQELRLPALGRARVKLSTWMDRGGPIDLSAFTMRRDEGLLVEIDRD
jgi:alpha-glucosidase